MATAAMLASSRRRQSPSPEAFLSPIDLSDVPLLQALSSISSEILTCFSDVRFSFQRRNSRSLLRKVQVIALLLDHLPKSTSLDSTVTLLCFKELYLLLHHSKFLLRYCAHSSKLWLLLQSPSISSFFHDLSKDYSTLLDVLHVDSLCLSHDVREQVDLFLHKQHSSFDSNEETTLRNRLHSFLDSFESGSIPNSEELTFFFVEKLGIRDQTSFRDEIQFLEEQIKSYNGCCDHLEPTRSVVNITRYVMCLLFKTEDESKKQRKKEGLIYEEIKHTFTTLPKDFLCSISLSLMTDPVIVSTGQTYERSSIARWVQEGHSTCPKTGQKLVDLCFVPNLALRHLITLWCQVNGLDSPSPPKESLPKVVLFQTRASMEANKATLTILVQNLADGSELAAREIRLLSRIARETRTLIVEAGGIPYLRGLLKSKNAVAQENAVACIFNLTMDEANKSVIMEEEDCLEAIMSVLVSGLTMIAKEIAAATLYTLSSVHDYKKTIANADGCIEGLGLVLQNGTARGKKDAVYALHSLWLHPDNCSLMVNGGGVSALVGALAEEAVAEKVAHVLGVVASESLGAESIGREETAVTGLMEVMRSGTPKGKEKAIATMLQLCTNGGAVVTEKVVKTPTLAVLTRKLLLTGTDRAKRKAVSLSRVL